MNEESMEEFKEWTLAINLPNSIKSWLVLDPEYGQVIDNTELIRRVRYVMVRGVAPFPDKAFEISDEDLLRFIMLSVGTQILCDKMQVHELMNGEGLIDIQRLNKLNKEVEILYNYAKTNFKDVE